MAQKKFEKGSEEYVMFQAYYKMIQEIYIPEDTDKYWDQALKKVQKFCDDYATVPLAMHLGVAILNDIEKRWKGCKHG